METMGSGIVVNNAKNTVIENNKGYKKTIKTDIFGNKIIEDNHGKKQIIKKDIFGNVIIENY